jgi:hypothetical protein
MRTQTATGHRIARAVSTRTRDVWNRIARAVRAACPSIVTERVWTPWREWRVSRYHKHPQTPADRIERCVRGCAISVGRWRVYIVWRAIARQTVHVAGQRVESAPYRCGWR